MSFHGDRKRENLNLISQKLSEKYARIFRYMDQYNKEKPMLWHVEL